MKKKFNFSKEQKLMKKKETLTIFQFLNKSKRVDKNNEKSLTHKHP